MPARSKCGVLGNDDPEASVAGEIVPAREFYDYEAKYLDDGSDAAHPGGARPSRRRREVRRLAVEAFRAVDVRRHGARRLPAVDATSGRLYVNEVNTIPGFTTISMFSQLWAATGVDYPALLDRLSGWRSPCPRKSRGRPRCQSKQNAVFLMKYHMVIHSN